MASGRREEVEITDNNPIQWVPVHLSKDEVEFDTNSLEHEVRINSQYNVTISDGLAKIERAWQLVSTVSQGKYQLLAR